MKNRTCLFLPLFLFLFSACSVGKINRQQVVQRHNIKLTETGHKPLQVGNGNFAFNVDITGLQTFAAHNTMSHWAFHSMPLPPGIDPKDFTRTVRTINGRPVEFEIDNPKQPVLSKWLAANPHAANLGRIGLRLSRKDGSPAAITDLKNPVQHLDLWSGVITSSFDFDGTRVEVKTACHPARDEIGIQVNSALVSKGQLKIALDFPYGDDREFTEFVGDYNNPQKHTTKLQKMGQHLFIQRAVDDLRYSLTVKSGKGIVYERADSVKNPHKLVLAPQSDLSQYTFHFSKDAGVDNSAPGDIFGASKGGWKAYWMSGAAVDFSKCTDARAFELERRIVTSQYLMKVNNAGSLPPAETGLFKNSWYGKFHFEMIWWHGV
ncbi:MAG TPA: hypothetical protein VEY06_05805, partial [Flavisolibacter sp.]|nr:hypothetical protein [Flavisolibacter sp.]